MNSPKEIGRGYFYLFYNSGHVLLYYVFVNQVEPLFDEPASLTFPVCN